jgi:endonuclease/exonuclease/phosphatase family metal-dependent hydrolase
LGFDLGPSIDYQLRMTLGLRVRVTLFAFLIPTLLEGETFRVATYNVENYLDRPTESRPHPKSATARARVCESIRALRPDVIALQEMGSASALHELRSSLKAGGLDFPYSERVEGFDTNLHVAVLSRFPFTARRPHTNDSFLLSGRRFRVSRGIAEVEIQVNPRYSFTLISAHLKSKRPVPEADEAEMRLQEARVLRRIVDSHLVVNPRDNLIVLGDFNDVKDAASTREIIGRGKRRLVDTRPAEPKGHKAPASYLDARSVTWTHYYGKEDTYSRIDYILVSPGMAREWLPGGTYIPTLPDWGIASDHRPLVATFQASDR